MKHVYVWKSVTNTKIFLRYCYKISLFWLVCEMDNLTQNQNQKFINYYTMLCPSPPDDLGILTHKGLPISGKTNRKDVLFEDHVFGQTDQSYVVAEVRRRIVRVNLTKQDNKDNHYRGKNKSLRGVDLHIPRGRWVGSKGLDLSLNLGKHEIFCFNVWVKFRVKQQSYQHFLLKPLPKK